MPTVLPGVVFLLELHNSLMKEAANDLGFNKLLPKIGLSKHPWEKLLQLCKNKPLYVVKYFVLELFMLNKTCLSVRESIKRENATRAAMLNFPQETRELSLRFFNHSALRVMF